MPRPPEPMEMAGLERRMQERRWLLLVSVVVLVGLGLTYRAKTRAFASLEDRLARQEVVNLTTLESSRALMPALSTIYPDPVDQRLAAAQVYRYILRQRAEHPLYWAMPNVGFLNTEALDVPADQAAQGGEAFTHRLKTAREAAGADSSRVAAVSLLGGAADVQRLKPRLIVRTPTGFMWRFLGLVVLYFGAIYGVHAFWFRRRMLGDPVLLPVVHLLTGVALMLMFSLPDPLRDLMRASGYVMGVAAGSVLMGGVSLIDFQHARWRKQAYAWLGVGVLLAAALYFFGSGPTGSAAKVNLVLPLIGPVQPVEGVKLCLVLFMAAYFARHWAFLRDLKQREGVPRFLQRFDLPRYRDLAPVALGVVITLVTFFALRDMGPALVMACTFLVLYGVVRNRWVAVGGGFVALGGVFWYSYRTGLVPMVADRVQMLVSPWENFVMGGEHLSHAFWAMATGGVTGQGLGMGHPSFIPAAHTDMVLPALGEELGLVGLVVLFALYGLLIGRMVTIARRAGGVYSLFLGLGVALMLLAQVLLIGGGTFGLVPLSGVVTPFLSYGKSSMVAHMVMVGMLVSLSTRPASAVQATAQAFHFRRPLRRLMAVAVVLLAGLVVRAAYVQVMQADAWSIKPTLVLRGHGERAYVYNPRILAARQSLTRGTIYDRHGIPLASSRWDDLDGFRLTYAGLGIDLDTLDRTTARYYPFQALTFYLLGDVNTRVKWGADNSLYAEHAYLSHLRGYDNHPQPVEKRRTPQGITQPLVRYDYTDLVSLVRYGPRSPDARALLRRDRDLYLTVDVRLQRRVAEILTAQAPPGKTATAVVLDVVTGEVLASVTTPLPAQAHTAPTAAHKDPNLFDRGFGQGAKAPGSTFKLVTAIAALNQDLDAAAWTHEVRSTDRYARRNEPTGRVRMARALASSSNVYFAALAHEVVGPDSLLDTMHRFGFRVGQPGLSRARQLALLKQPDNLRQVGFGQGPLTGSPLEVAVLAATIANGGRRPTPQWVRSRYDLPRGGPYLILPRHAEALGAMMRRAVTDRKGTARVLLDLPVPVAGKTGTAEERQVVGDGRSRRLRTVNHAWFTGFAPYHAPGEVRGRQLAIAVLVEEGGLGGQVAAPLAGAIVAAAADLGLITAPTALAAAPATPSAVPTVEWLSEP